MSAVPIDTAPEWIKACCADVYGTDLVAQVLGPSYHPGGRELTRRLARMACLRPGERVLDVACGPGDSTMLLAREFDVRVHGVDLSPRVVARAASSAGANALTGQVSFAVADAEALPVGSGTFDGILCECALCTFPDKARAVRAFARSLAPGGRLMLSDVVVDHARLPGELRTPLARVACVADALPVDAYLRLLETAGLRVCGLEHHDEAVIRMTEQIDGRLALLAAAGLEEGVNVAEARRLASIAIRAAEAGVIGYVVLTAELDGAVGTAVA